MNKRSWILHAVVLLFIFLIGFGPVLVSLSAGAFASANGCRLHEGGPNPCVVGGRDWGNTLYSLGVIGWLSIASVPLAALMFFGYLGFVIARWLMKRREWTKT